MKSYSCTYCGGQVNLEKMICEYCGTMFQIEENELIRAVVCNPDTHVHILDSHAIIPKEFLDQLPKEESEYMIKRKLAQELIERIQELMEVTTMELPSRNEMIFATRLRMLDSEYRFK